MSALKTLCKLLEESGARVTFSINCHSGIVSLLGQGAVCGCWRCREERGEPWSEETEIEAAVQSREASRKLRESVIEAFRKAEVKRD